MTASQKSVAVSATSFEAMPSYDPRRPLARYSRTLLFGVGTFIALSMLVLLYHRSGDSMGSALKPMPIYAFPRHPSEPPRAIDSPYWPNPASSSGSGPYHVFLVENHNRYEKTPRFIFS